MGAYNHIVDVHITSIDLFKYKIQQLLEISWTGI